MMMVMMMVMTQHFSNSRVKNNVQPSLLVIPHDYPDRWVEKCYLQAKKHTGGCGPEYWLSVRMEYPPLGVLLLGSQTWESLPVRLLSELLCTCGSQTEENGHSTMRLGIWPLGVCLSSEPRFSLRVNVWMCIWRKLDQFHLNPDLEDNSKIWRSHSDFTKDSLYIQLPTVGFWQPRLCQITKIIPRFLD